MHFAKLNEFSVARLQSMNGIDYIEKSLGWDSALAQSCRLAWRCLGELVMKTGTLEIRQYFRPVIDSRPWRVKLGVGSSLTFEFGPRIRAHGHLHGQWHLWIFLSNWTLSRGNRQLVDSDADRKLITISTRRLEEEPLSDVDFNARTRKTTFSFGDFRLSVSPADYLDNPDDRDHYWMFFMPDNQVLSVGPAGVRVERSDVPQPSAIAKREEVEIHTTSARSVRGKV